jgi:hypothetical protein
VRTPPTPEERARRAVERLRCAMGEVAFAAAELGNPGDPKPEEYYALNRLWLQLEDVRIALDKKAAG